MPAEETLIIDVRTNPYPVNSFVLNPSQRSQVVVDANTPYRTDLLEMERRVTRIFTPKAIRLAGLCLISGFSPAKSCLNLSLSVVEEFISRTRFPVRNVLVNFLHKEVKRA